MSEPEEANPATWETCATCGHKIRPSAQVCDETWKHRPCDLENGCLPVERVSDIEPPDITARELLTRADGLIQWAHETNTNVGWRAAATAWTDLNGRFGPVLRDAYDEGHDAGAAEMLDAGALTAGQEIRARALDSAARFLGPGMATVDDATDDDYAELWLEVADDAARFIATGEITRHAEPAPPLEGDGAAGEPVVAGDWISVTEAIAAARSNWNALPSWIVAAYDRGGLLFRPTGVDILVDGVEATAARGEWLVLGSGGAVLACATPPVPGQPAS